jgi:hypothetical protein
VWQASYLILAVQAFETAKVARRFLAHLFFVRLDQLAMGGGSLAHRNPLSCLVNTPNHRHSNCHPRLPTAAWHNHHKPRSSRSFTRLRVAQQFDTLTDVNTKPAEAQQELLQDQLQAAVEEAVPVVGGIALSAYCLQCLASTGTLEFLILGLTLRRTNVLAVSSRQQLHTASTPWCSQHSSCRLVCCLQEVPPDVLTEFEQVLEEDLASVSVTLAAVTGVIIFWRGVWSLLDCESPAC